MIKIEPHSYIVGDTFPNIQGVIAYSGAVNTSNLQVALLANGKNTGPFTGDVLPIGGDSENSSSSTFYWTFGVDASMTQKEGSYKLDLLVTHPDSGQVQTLDANLYVVVKEID